MAETQIAPNRETLLERVKALAQTLNRHHITQEEFHADCGVSRDRVRQIFGSHGGMLRAAGLQPYTRRRLIDGDLLRSLRDACIAAGGIVARSQAPHYGARHSSTYLRRWRTWRDVLVALRDWAIE